MNKSNSAWARKKVDQVVAYALHFAIMPNPPLVSDVPGYTDAVRKQLIRRLRKEDKWLTAIRP